MSLCLVYKYYKANRALGMAIYQSLRLALVRYRMYKIIQTMSVEFRGKEFRGACGKN